MIKEKHNKVKKYFNEKDKQNICFTMLAIITLASSSIYPKQTTDVAFVNVLLTTL